MISVVEALDDAAIAKFVLTLGAEGNLRIVTLKAFTEEAYRNIIAANPRKDQ